MRLHTGWARDHPSFPTWPTTDDGYDHDNGKGKILKPIFLTPGWPYEPHKPCRPGRGLRTYKHRHISISSNYTDSIERRRTHANSRHHSPWHYELEIEFSLHFSLLAPSSSPTVLFKDIFFFCLRHPYHAHRTPLNHQVSASFFVLFLGTAWLVW